MPNAQHSANKRARISSKPSRRQRIPKPQVSPGFLDALNLRPHHLRRLGLMGRRSSATEGKKPRKPRTLKV